MNKKNPRVMYLDAVKKSLRCNLKDSKKFLDGLQTELLIYDADYPLSKLQNYYETFGKPEEIASQFLENIDPVELESSKKRKRNKIIVVFILLVFLTVMLAYFLIQAIKLDPYKAEIIVRESQQFILTDEEIEKLKQQEESKNE